MKLAVLVNPHAGAARRDPALPARLAQIAGGDAEVIATTVAELPAVAAGLRARGISLIAICGGDGTAHATINELVRAYGVAPCVALLRGGTMNTVASNLGVRESPAVLLARLIARVRAGVPLPQLQQPILSVNGRLGFLFGTALAARILELYYEHPAPSLSRAVQLAARISTSALGDGALARRLFHPLPLGVQLDGGAPLRFDASLVVAGTVVDVGVGMRICPRAADAPDRFQLVVSGLGPRVLARQLLAALAGRALVGAAHLDRVAREAELELDEEEPYTIDGELFRGRRLSLRAAPPITIVRA